MLKFRQLIVDRKNNYYKNTEYIPQMMFLYRRYKKFLADDFALDGRNFYDYFLDLVEEASPYFWVIFSDDEAAGFVYLENFTGNSEKLHCAEVTTCFDKKFWGGFTYYAAIVFFNYCFENLGLKKVKALIYPENFRVVGLLNRCGFIKEALLKSETMRGGKPQDMVIYSLGVPL